MQNNILVTGGAGYIGSHVVRQLTARGESVVVLDNLISGNKDAIIDAELVIGDVGNKGLVSELIRDKKIASILHFAAHTIIPESLENPLKYYRNNTANTLNLLECCQACDIKHFLFSSTAAVYGDPDEVPVHESAPTNPTTPYGMSKLMSELMLRDVAAVHDLNYAILRYFNVAGCDPMGRIGHSFESRTLLTQAAAEAATGKRDQVFIYGTDYPTPDGTGVRDYIHVEDLASAHLKALDYLRQGRPSITLNAGYGHGFSVREVLGMFSKVNGKDLNIVESERRPGDLPVVIAKADKIRSVLDWEPKYDDLEEIVRSSLNWERKLQKQEKPEVN